jgi:GcrA cell cycle regulator
MSFTARNGQNSDWTDERAETLRALWLQQDPHLSAGRIAQLMGTTKNAIIGRAHRMGLAARPSPITPRGVPKPPRERAADRPAYTREQVSGLRAAEAARMRQLPRLVAPAAPPVAPPMAPRFTGPAGCRWPMWGIDERPTHRYCDAPRLASKAYCGEHCAKAFVPLHGKGFVLKGWGR